MNDYQKIECIRRYWRDRGQEVNVEMRDCTDVSRSGHQYHYSAIRSDMPNGLPIGYRGELTIQLTRKRIA